MRVLDTFQLLSPSRALLDAPCPSGRFSLGSRQFLDATVWRPCGASAVFCFAWSPWARRVPLRTFPSKENESCHSGRSGDEGGQGAGVLLLWVQAAQQAARCGRGRRHARGSCPSPAVTAAQACPGKGHRGRTQPPTATRVPGTLARPGSPCCSGARPPQGRRGVLGPPLLAVGVHLALNAEIKSSSITL